MKIAVKKDADQIKQLGGQVTALSSQPELGFSAKYPQTQAQDDSWVAVEKSVYEKITEDPDHFWFRRHVRINFDLKEFKSYEDACNNYKLRFECFMMGYLSFYDDVNRSCVIDHTMFFKWIDSYHHGKEKNDLLVEVYLNPAPQHGHHYLFNPNGERMKLVEDKSPAGLASTFTVDPPTPHSPPPPGASPTTNS